MHFHVPNSLNLPKWRANGKTTSYISLVTKVGQLHVQLKHEFVIIARVCSTPREHALTFSYWKSQTKLTLPSSSTLKRLCRLNGFRVSTFLMKGNTIHQASSDICAQRIKNHYTLVATQWQIILTLFLAAAKTKLLLRCPLHFATNKALAVQQLECLQCCP